MNNFDEEAFVREMAHAEIVQEQRKTVTFSGGHSYEVPDNDNTESEQRYFGKPKTREWI